LPFIINFKDNPKAHKHFWLFIGEIAMNGRVGTRLIRPVADIRFFIGVRFPYGIKKNKKKERK